MRLAVQFRCALWALLVCEVARCNLLAQTQVDGAGVGGMVGGTVISAVDTAPVRGALMTLIPVSPHPETPLAGNGRSRRDRNRSTLTSISGSYRFSGLLPGRYRLLIAHDGFDPVEMALEIGIGTDLAPSAALEVEPVTMVPLRQDTTAVVTGRVTDVKDGQPLANVEVTVEGTQIRAVTDAEGRYWLVRVPPGPQILRTRRIGYAPNRVPVSVPPRGTLTQDVVIAQSALLVEGITVTGDAVSRARGELATATVIETEAVRSQTAATLRGVLELVPGVAAEPPGLDNIEQIALRAIPTSGRSGISSGYGTATADLAAFGTLIVLNDVPLSNNANLQQLGRGNELYFTTNAGGGIDLREIPARTIERVEVIRGVPSTRYGDLTQGAIVVDTRAGAVEPDISLQVDERTVEASLVAGHSFAGERHAGTITFDFARTESSPGRTPDAVERFAAQFAHRAHLGTAPAGATQRGRLMLDTRVDAYQLLDDRPPHEYTRVWASRSRDRGLRVSERARLALAGGTGLSFTGSLSVLQQRGSTQRTLTRGPMPFTDRLTAGRSVGRYFLGDYEARSSMDGDPWLLFGRFEGDAAPEWFGLRHSVRTGIELRREWNSGPGYQFDILNPPQVTFNGVNGFARPRSYDSIPPLVTAALYWDDRASTILGNDMLLTLQAGLRLDVLHEGSHWFSSPRDVALEPRFNLEFSPWRWLRLRGGWGLVAKAPSLAQLFPEPHYYDVINVNWFTPEPEERLAVLTTVIEDPGNEELGFAVAEKAEAGFELGFGRSAISVAAFRDKVRHGIAIRGTPGYILRDHYDLVDSTRGTGVPPEIVEPAAYSDTVPTLLEVPANMMTVTSRGIELTASLPEIPSTRTRLHVIGQWIETEQTVDALYFGSQFRFGEFALAANRPRTPYWGPSTETAERILATYRVIHHQPELGLIITAILQHNISDRQVDLAATDTLAYLGYLTRDARLVSVPEDQRGLPENHDLRMPRSGTLSTPQEAPADWMLSVQVSKTFPLDGRLSFWAYNVLDRTGTYGDIDTAQRIYSKMRFGLEFTMPVRGLLGWAY